ncbi:hypothetical protein CDL40_14990 [Escherichia coli]|nr:hypothetical protein CDL40_14990 [Escherichia coli]
MCCAGLVDFTELQYINIWWSWRELNPRPKFLHTIFTITESVIYVLKQYVSVILYFPVLSIFNVMPPKCRHCI